MTTLVCWNVAGRVKQLAAQVRRVTDLAADVICLQEVTATTAPRWRAELADAGWEYQAVALAHADDPKRRPLSVMTASRSPLELRPPPTVPWSERVLVTTTGAITLINVHSPISESPNLAKVLTHEAIYAYLRRQPGPAVLCGDLNTPRRENPDGSVWTFARTQHGKLRPERGERWDTAELSLITGLRAAGWRDGFRELHGISNREFSWGWARWPGGYRIDHLIVSPQIQLGSVSYIHEWRTDGLSDHSPLFAEITI